MTVILRSSKDDRDIMVGAGALALAALRASHPGARIWAVFEPRSASSCRRVFQDDFARAFSGADEYKRNLRVVRGAAERTIQRCDRLIGDDVPKPRAS